MFNEYAYKDFSNRIVIQFTRKDDIVPRPWEISNFINNYSSTYYKVELLNTISLALNNGILPQNIIILDASFKIDKAYAKLDTIKMTDIRLKDLYSIGKPISLFPNEEIYILHLYFKLFENLNQRLFLNRSKRISRKYVSSYYDTILKEGVKNGVKMLIADGIKHLNNPNDHAVASIQKLYDTYVQLYENFLKDNITISAITKELMGGSEKIEKEYPENIKKYFVQFFKSFNSLARPVIGIYYPEEKTIQILCKEHIIYGHSEIREAKFLDIKEVSHNSPLKAIFEGGISVIKTIKEEKRQDELHELEIERRKIEIRMKELKLQEMEAKLETAELQKLGVMIDCELSK